jgi:hypothetical protein
MWSETGYSLGCGKGNVGYFMTDLGEGFQALEQVICILEGFKVEDAG